jgi:hypothetical protein
MMIYFIQMRIIIIKELFLVFNMPVSDRVFTWKAYIMREGFKVNSMCGRCDKSHESFKYFGVNKINETAVTTKKLTNNFAGLVSSGLRPDVASRPPAACTTLAQTTQRLVYRQQWLESCLEFARLWRHSVLTEGFRWFSHLLQPNARRVSEI